MKTTQWIGLYLGFPSFITLIAGAFFALVMMGGCHPNPGTVKNMETASKYAAELAECIETSATIAQSRICRCDVNQRWGRACVDEITVKP